MKKEKIKKERFTCFHTPNTCFASTKTTAGKYNYDGNDDNYICGGMIDDTYFLMRNVEIRANLMEVTLVVVNIAYCDWRKKMMNSHMTLNSLMSAHRFGDWRY